MVTVSYPRFYFVYLEYRGVNNSHRYTDSILDKRLVNKLMKKSVQIITALALVIPFVASTANAYETIDNGQEVITVPSTPEEQQLWEDAYQAEQARAEKAKALQTQRQAQYRINPRPVVYQPRANQPQQAPEAGELFDAATSGNVQRIGQLLSQGIDVNVSNAERETALHMAAARGQYRAVIYLVKNGAYVSARTIKNWIPLHHATRFNHPNIVNYLLQHKSSARAQTSDGMSSIDMAKTVNNNRMLSILGAR